MRGPESAGRTRERALSQAPRLSAAETSSPAQLQVKDDWLGSPVLFKLFLFLIYFIFGSVGSLLLRAGFL